MTIDEAITHAREVAIIHSNNDKLNKTLGDNSPYYNTDCLKCAEEHEQLAEWLEELKTTRIALEKANGCLEANWKLGYQKAIEDFVDYAGDILSTSDRDFYCSGVIDEIAEQLKAGGTDE